jgi:hypothetical protein
MGVIFLITVCLFITNTECLSQNTSKEKVTDKNFQQLYADCYVIKFSNVFMMVDNKKIIIPIYNGTYGDVDLDELKKVQKSKADILSSLIFYSKKGKLKNTLIDFLNFYKKSLLKDNDVKKPTVIGGEGDSYIIWYDFVYEGINSSMMIHLSGDEKNMDELDEKRIRGRDRTIDMVEFNAKADNFRVSINIGEESGFKK